jgi:hypothetical protein
MYINYDNYLYINKMILFIYGKITNIVAKEIHVIDSCFARIVCFHYIKQIN